jgi:hypothetical protein
MALLRSVNSPSPRAHWIGDSVCLLDGLGDMESGNILPLLGLVQPIANRYTDCVITENIGIYYMHNCD